MVCQSNVDKTAQSNKFFSKRMALFYLLIILCKFEDAILKIIYNMASSNNNFKSCRQDESPPLA